MTAYNHKAKLAGFQGTLESGTGGPGERGAKQKFGRTSSFILIRCNILSTQERSNQDWHKAESDRDTPLLLRHQPKVILTEYIFSNGLAFTFRGHFGSLKACCDATLSRSTVVGLLIAIAMSETPCTQRFHALRVEGKERQVHRPVQASQERLHLVLLICCSHIPISLSIVMLFASRHFYLRAGALWPACLFGLISKSPLF